MSTGSRHTLSVSVLALLLAVMLAVPAVSMAAPVPLGTTSSYGVLAGSTITNTGPTTIGGTAGGDIGVSPGSAITGFPPGIRSGATHAGDAAAAQAQIDLTAAYDDARLRTPATAIPAQLGGQLLEPGVYVPSSGDFQITGTLTLHSDDPDGVFVFQCPAGLTTASSSRIVLTGQAQYCRVFWQVTSSAILGTNSTFVGHLFALTSISAQTGAQIQGQLLARNGAVTLDSNTIINGPCEFSEDVNITKTAAPLALTGPGSVTYTYRVTNINGEVALTGVTVTDDKLGSVAYSSGDTNSNGELDTNETWIYTATTNLAATTTNIATVRATVPNVGATADTALATVVVSRTISGGVLPKTGTPWYNLLLAGAALALVGAAGYWRTTRKIHA